MRVCADGRKILERGEVDRMMQTTYLVNNLLRDDPDSAEKSRALAALEQIKAVARKYGAKHFNKDGTVKETEARKAKVPTEAK